MNKSSVTDETQFPVHSDLKMLKGEALGGSGAAAMQLSLWYMKFPEGKNTALYWKRIAAENGSASGQFNLGVALLAETSDPQNAVRARFWLQRSANQGVPQAIDMLAKLNRDVD